MLLQAAKRLYLVTLPFAAGTLLAALAHPLVAFLRRHRVPQALAVSAAALAGLAVVAGAGIWVALSLASGICCGVTAGFVRSLAGHGGHGPVAVLGHWQLWAIVVLGPFGVLLSQNSYQAGRVGALALTVITVTDPLVSIAVGLLWLGEAVVTAIPAALALFTAGAAGLAAANPPLDAARLDIVPSGLWGRAESLRTVLRLAAEAIAPVSFGFVADLLGGHGGRAGATGLRDAFLIMLIPLLANAALVVRARHTYLADAAKARHDRRDGTGRR